MQNRSWRKTGLWLILTLTFLGSAPLALPQPASNKPQPTLSPTPEKAKGPTTAASEAEAARKEEDQRVRIEHADTLRYNGETKLYQLRGSVIFSNKEMKLYCDSADYNEAKDSARATGHLRIVSPDAVCTGDLVEADFARKLIVLTGHVQIIAQRKRANKQPGGDTQGQVAREKGGSKTTPVGANGSNKPPAASPEAAGGKQPASGEPGTMQDYAEKRTVITCERLEYYYADDVKQMIATPRVKAVQEDKTLWADKAIYDEGPRQITLIDNVLVQTEKGDEMRCTKALISVDEDWMQAENMTGITTRREKGGTSKPPATGGAATTPAATLTPATPTPPPKTP
jgi:lipopolysaccharide assembly outer membrane protein LptD (OstA)